MITKVFKDKYGNGMEVIMTEPMPPVISPEYEKRILKEGTVYHTGKLPLPCDILCEKNVPIPMRDGTIIYTDVFRPVSEEKVPCMIAWSPYGKEHNSSGEMRSLCLSGLEKFEGPDPAYWVSHGYAVFNVDPRGVNYSEGDLLHWGCQLAMDGYDTVEWAASQEYASGKVTFSGTSYLAISQWFIAALKPPHLTCIAPWEGFSDVYNDNICPGGIPDYEFEACVSSSFRGLNLREDMAEMARLYPVMNPYWRDKQADLSKVSVPAYVVASFANKVHTRGTLAAYTRINSKEKWLRVHNTHEWSDYYLHQEDLRMFYDYFMKGIENGWSKTPRVRLSVLDPGGTDIVNRPENAYPLPRTQEKVFYLDAAACKDGDSASGQITAVMPQKEASISYRADDGIGGAAFVLTFEEETEIVGCMTVGLYVEAEGCDDMDLFVMCRKLDDNNSELPVLVKGAPYSPDRPVPFEWGNGRCRVSMREFFSRKDSDQGSDAPSEEAVRKVSKGEIVHVSIPLCPLGMRFHRRQKLEIRISGYNPARPELPMQKPIRTINRGKHIIHTGAEHPSVIVLPVS